MKEHPLVMYLRPENACDDRQREGRAMTRNNDQRDQWDQQDPVPKKRKKQSQD